jgi:hypothetical protein
LKKIKGAMNHIVFNRSEITLMKEVMNLDNSLDGEVIQIRDEFGVGPLRGIDTEEGWQARVEWWIQQLKNSPYENDPQTKFDDRETLRSIMSKLDEDEQEKVWIWMGQNQHDVSGYYWLMSQLKNYQGRIFVIYLNNLPFLNEKGQLFYPSWLHEIMPKELLKAKRLARPITLSEFEVDPDEWRKLCEEDSIVRILEGGKKIAGVAESFYDPEILKNLTGEWQKGSRVLHNTINRMKIKTGDLYLMWRMKKLIGEGKIEVIGDPNKSWKDFDVRLAGKNSAEESQPAEASVKDNE